VNDQRLKIRLALSLFLLRLGVGVVFVMWTVDKFVNPEHAAAVFDSFYRVPGLSEATAYAVGTVQMAIVLAFLAGAFRTLSYLAILLMHAVSTLMSYEKYLDPWTSPNLLFFAAFPMLAACAALWLLRRHDTMASVDARRRPGGPGR